MGEFSRAKEHLDAAIAIYDPRLQLSISRYGGADIGSSSLSFAGLTLWQLGYPDRALEFVNQGLASANGLSHPQSLALAELTVGYLRVNRGEADAAQEMAESLIALSAEHSLADYSAWATTLRGWAMAEHGHNEEAIAQMQEGLTAFRASRVELGRTRDLCFLSKAFTRTGRFDAALSALTEALAVAYKHEEREFEAEIYRLKGELMLSQDDLNIAEAQNCFQRAIEIARKQSAKSWELRATMSLARLLAKQGRNDEVRTMLANIYGWFTEGFDTADLKDAKALLGELAT
jgi:predicted ATPase